MSPYRKVTYSLPEEVTADIDRVVENGDAPSKSAVVAEALTQYFARRLADKREQVWKQAARDPDFIRRNREVMLDFAVADAEAWASLPPWDDD